MRNGFALIAVGAMALMLLGTGAGPRTEAPPDDLDAVVKALRSQDRKVRDACVDDLLGRRAALIRRLSRLIDPGYAGQYRDETRCAAAYLLGELRAVEAVPVLARALADEPGPIVSSKFDDHDMMPVTTALYKIGLPAVMAMIENILTSDERGLRSRSLSLLNSAVGGKRRLLEVLGKVAAHTTDPERVRRIKAAQAEVLEKFSETKEPLF